MRIGRSRFCVGLAAVVLWGGGSCLLSAQDAAPQASYCPSADARIGQITVERIGVFESGTGETARWIAGGAKALHPRTREVVVRRELLFQTGDRCDNEALGQTERNLRALGFFRHVEILTQPAGGRDVDVLVRVRDAFTLRLNAGYKREGGTDTWDAKVGETNVAGLGFGLWLRRTRNFERGLSGIAFSEPRLLGTRERLAVAYDHRSDGHAIQMSLARPFHSVDARWSHDLLYSETRDRLRLYDGGAVTQKWERRSIDASIGAAVRLGAPTGNHAWRASVGYRYRTREYFDAMRPPVPDFGGQPTPRLLSGPFAGIRFVSHRYIERTGLVEPDRVLDLNLGVAADFSVMAAHRVRAFGTQALTVLSGGASRGWHLPGGGVALSSASGVLELDRSAATRGEFGMTTRAWWAPSPLHVRAALVEVHGLVNPDAGQRVYLGGTPGLRGYRQNAFCGSSSLLLVFEERYYLNWVPLGLLRPGVVAFGEMALLGGTNHISVAEDSSLAASRRVPGLVHGDVGIGLRIASPRLPAGVAIRLDLAFPLEKAAGRSRRPLLFVGYRSDF